MKSLARRGNEKLAPKFFMPYEITHRIGEVVYHVKLPKGSQIHPMFHVSQFHKALRHSHQSQPILLHLTEDLEWVAKPLDILLVIRQTNKTEVLVKWKNLHDFEST